MEQDRNKMQIRRNSVNKGIRRIQGIAVKSLYLPRDFVVGSLWKLS